jgi:hypothetical protein
MTKYVLSSSALALVLAAPAIASAQSAPSGTGCPPGSWFCSQDEAPAAPSHELETLPDPDQPAPPPPVRRRPSVTYAPPPPPPYGPPPPPAVVYQPPPPTMLVRPEAPPPYEYDRRPKPVSPPHEWGLNLHLEGADLGSGVEHNAGMGGAGLRFKPSRYFGIETDLDFVGGHGYVGDLRHETALSFNGLFFLNPKSRAQFYLLAGFGWSWANSQNDPNDPSSAPYNYNYSYFGGQAGIGLELRLTRVLAFNADVRGFVRTRTDQLATTQPEFTNSQGQSTNTSGGGLFTGGMTLYF